ncbi:hypothetical protein E4K72_00470 [Oxalobacteraceae bacterium OM1]|nr:hypothetical protein E4K72_00470 [Oxalobacteraceae bacterium OM1]
MQTLEREHWFLQCNNEEALLAELGKAMRQIGYRSVSEGVLRSSTGTTFAWQVTGAQKSLTIARVADGALAITGETASIHELKNAVITGQAMALLS